MTPEEKLAAMGAKVREFPTRKPNGRVAAARPAAAAVMSATELMGRSMPMLRWALRQILPVGYAVLAGPPKLGKSWLALQWCPARG